MKMMKIPVIASDDVTASNFNYVDVSTLQDVTIGATTLVVTGLGWTLTATLDGTDGAETLVNVNLLADYLVPLLLEYNGNDVNRKESQKVYKLWHGLSTPEICALAGGIEKTGDLGNAFVSLALS